VASLAKVASSERYLRRGGLFPKKILTLQFENISFFNITYITNNK
jgi:hypothetical protein